MCLIFRPHAKVNVYKVVLHVVWHVHPTTTKNSDILIDVWVDTLSFIFKISEFWLWTEFATISEVAPSILLLFPTTYICENGVLGVNYIVKI